MKQFIKIIGQCVYLCTLMIVLSNCNNKNSNNTVTSYRWQNGLCYNNLNQQVATSNCGANLNTNYYLAANGQCMDRTTGYQVQLTLCQNTGGVYGSQVCIGYYYYPTNGTSGYCQTTGTVNNCSGFTMVSSTGQTVTCL